MPVSSTATRFQFASRRREARWQHVGAFALSAVLLMLAFPRPGWGFLAYVALVPAGVAAGRTMSWRTLFIVGLIVYGVWWGWMLRWLGPISPAASPVIGLILGAMMSGAVLSAGVLYQKLRWPMVVALPLTWVAVESLRSVWPAGGFAWLSLAHSQAMWDTGDVGRVIQTADLFGQHTVGLIVAAVNGAVVDALLRRKLPRRIVISAGLLLVGAWGYGQWRIGQWEAVTQDGPTIAVVQTAVVQDNKVQPTAQELAANWEALVKLHFQVTGKTSVLTGEEQSEVSGEAEESSASGNAGGGASNSQPGQLPGLVVWPETIVPAPLNAAGEARMSAIAGVARYEGETEAEALRRIQDYGLKTQLAEAVRLVVKAGGVPTLLGASTMEFDPEFARYNSAFLYGTNGTQAGPAYHKQHRVPMGEYIPGPWFVESLVAWMSPWEADYQLTPGGGPVVFTLPGGWQVGTPICYEDVVAGICRRMVYGDEGKRLDALVNLTNDGWYPGKSMRRQHAALASLRCIENRVPMARSVNTGISTFIDSLGRCSTRLGESESGVLTHMVRVDERTTLYAGLGGWPWVLFVLFAIGATAFGAVFGRPVAKHRLA